MEKEAAYEEALQKADALEVIVLADEAVRYCGQIIDLLQQAGDYKDAPSLIEKYTAYAKEIKEQEQQTIYDKACRKLQQEHTKEGLQRALMEFESLGEYRDVAEKKRQCQHALKVVTRRHVVAMVCGLVLTVTVAAVTLHFVKNVLINDPIPQVQRTAEVKKMEKDA